MTHNKEGIKVIDYNFEAVTKLNNDKDLNGLWEFKINDNEVLEKGSFSKGLKTCTWEYLLYDSLKSTYSIKWAINEFRNINISLPNNWQLLPQENIYFTAIFPSASQNKSNKYFCIFINEWKDKSLNDFFPLHKKKTFESIKVKEYSHYKIVLDNKELYYSTYLKEENNENILILDLLLLNDGKAYELIYSSLNESSMKKTLLFFEIVRNFEINGDKQFPYLSEKLTIQRID